MIELDRVRTLYAAVRPRADERTGLINSWGDPRRQPLRKGTRTENADIIYNNITMPRSLFFTFN